MHPLDIQYIAIEKKAKSYKRNLTDKDLTLVNNAYNAISTLIRESSLYLSVLLNDGNINSDDLNNLSERLFIIQSFLVNTTHRKG